MTLLGTGRGSYTHVCVEGGELTEVSIELLRGGLLRRYETLIIPDSCQKNISCWLVRKKLVALLLHEKIGERRQYLFWGVGGGEKINYYNIRDYVFSF